MLGFIISTITLGLHFAFAAMGVFISFRIFKIPDMTTDGSFLIGGAVTALLLTQHLHPVSATLLGGIAGAAAGTVTGFIHTRFRINAIVTGIIVTSALYSVSKFVMDGPSLPLHTETTLMTIADNIASTVFRADKFLEVSTYKYIQLLAAFITALGSAFVLRAFFKTHFGLAMRASGDNERMITPLGVNVNIMLVLGLALANGLVAISGGLYIQESGLASSDMGFGQLIGGLGAVLVGKELMVGKSFGWGIIGAVIGSVVIQIVIALVLFIDPEDVWSKLVTSVFLLAVLLIPDAVRRMRAQSTAALGGD